MKNFLLVFLLFSSVCFGKENMELLISAEQIAEKVQEVALRIDQDYAGKELTIIMIMKGSICITADLMRYIKTPTTLEYIKASSYGKNGTCPGELYIDGFDTLDIEGKDVLVVDDIFDTGKTMNAVLNKLAEKKPKSLKSLVLLLKDVPRKIKRLPEYPLFVLANRFVIGYGLDYKEYYRGLPGIYAFINDTPPD